MMGFKRAVTAAACAFGVALGGVVVAGPASAAGSAQGRYTCDMMGTSSTSDFPDVTIDFQRDSAGFLTVTAPGLGALGAIAPNTLDVSLYFPAGTANVHGLTNSASIPAGVPTTYVASKAGTSSLSAAPGRISFYDGTWGQMIVCTGLGISSGFPI